MRVQNQETILRRIAVYEYTCSGGLLAAQCASDAASLMREGWAMLHALATDLAAIPGVHVQVLADHRGLPGPLPGCELLAVHNPADERELLTQLAASSDWTVVIAPETDRILFERCRLVESSGGRLLGPSSPLVDLLGDKQRTAEHLQAHHVRSPSGTDWRQDGVKIRFSSPLVVKPLDGAGAQGTYLVDQQSALDELLIDLAKRHGPQHAWRIETFEPGVPASVSALCGPAGCLLLPPCSQQVRFDGTISYHGGAYPLQPFLAKRAVTLARRAIETLSVPQGYIGIDMVLGYDPDGRDDRVIEINPRLTTSYVGLRVAARTNLAKAMLDVAEGCRPDLSFQNDPLEFDADGTVRACGARME